MKKTYRAIQVTDTEKFKMVVYPLVEPGYGQVRIKIEACGICHSDAFTVEKIFPNIEFPRVPGHEVVGKIDALGEGVNGWAIGQRVGVGYLAGHCGYCSSCRHGDFVNCANQGFSGIASDGGYAESMIAKASGLVAIPEGITSTEAAPLLCAGLTTFNALRNSHARGGDLVAIQGIGGLGHLAVQYANKMGFRVVAIDKGKDREELAKKLGAGHYIDSDVEDVSEVLKKMGGAKIILATAANNKAMSGLIGGLAPHGKMIVAGVGGNDPISVNPLDLLFGMRSVGGTLTGSSIDGEDTVAFSLQQNVRAVIETVSLDEAPAAYEKMMRGEARFRMVIDTSK